MTRALPCSASTTGHAHALEHQLVVQSPPREIERDVPADSHPRGNGKGRRIALIAGIVLGHVVTLFGPSLLGPWPLAPL